MSEQGMNYRNLSNAELVRFAEASGIGEHSPLVQELTYRVARTCGLARDAAGIPQTRVDGNGPRTGLLQLVTP